MKKFFFRLFLAAVIGFFIYFFISGNSLSDLTGKDGPISKEGFTKLKDQVLGTFSVENKDLEDVVSSTIDLDDENGSDPLSNLLKKFTGSDEQEDKDESQENTEDDVQKSTTTEDYAAQIEENTNLPDFNFVCLPEIKRECDFESCETKSPDINFILISSDDGLIHQCSLESCESFSYQGKRYSGSYNYQIQSDSGVYMVSRELESDDAGRTAYAEVRTEGIRTIMSLGRCLGK